MIRELSRTGPRARRALSASLWTGIRTEFSRLYPGAEVLAYVDAATDELVWALGLPLVLPIRGSSNPQGPYRYEPFARP